MGGGPAKKVLVHAGTFQQIISLENLFTAWREFRQGKHQRPDVQLFEHMIEDNIFLLHQQLSTGIYECGHYHHFSATDPKPRFISKATVRDRLLHHAIYRVLYPILDPNFIYDSYSSRKGKGTHKAFRRLVSFTRMISRNYTSGCFALKCDISRFFDSIDHVILMEQLRERIDDQNLLVLLKQIIDSFQKSLGKGLPLGNLTSQLLVNIYLDPLDRFIKDCLKAKYYLRYADDLIFLSAKVDETLGYFVEINCFLRDRLQLTIHPHKIFLRKLKWGIDFVGYVALPRYSLPRRKTVNRITKKIAKLLNEPEKLRVALPSYLGYLQHVNAYKVSRELADLAGYKT